MHLKEDWRQERACGQSGAAWAPCTGSLHSCLLPTSLRAAWHDMRWSWGILVFWEPSRLSPGCSQRTHQFSEIFLIQNTLFWPFSRVWAILTACKVISSACFDTKMYKQNNEVSQACSCWHHLDLETPAYTVAAQVCRALGEAVLMWTHTRELWHSLTLVCTWSLLYLSFSASSIPWIFPTWPLVRGSASVEEHCTLWCSLLCWEKGWIHLVSWNKPANPSTFLSWMDVFQIA